MAASTPTRKVVQVSVQSALLWPWVEGQAVYDPLVANKLRGIQNIKIGKSITTAKYGGGDTVHTLGGEEVGRTTQIKVSAVEVDYQTLNILEGGALSVHLATPAAAGPPAVAATQEQQYLADGYSDRISYFRLQCTSRVGSGLQIYNFAKLKVAGNVSYDMDMEKYTIPEFDCEVFFDEFFARMDGGIGGTYERFWSRDKTVTTLTIP